MKIPYHSECGWIAMTKNEKTNVMRILDRAGVEYEAHYYTPTGSITGAEAAQMLGIEPERVFKTLVCAAASGQHLVYMIPVLEELDLKKAAAVFKEKSVSMVKSKELLPLTGYIHGGCSPIDMKKQFRTAIDETCCLFDRIVFSAGKIGCQVELSPEDLKKIIPVEEAALTV